MVLSISIHKTKFVRRVITLALLITFMLPQSLVKADPIQLKQIYYSNITRLTSNIGVPMNQVGVVKYLRNINLLGLWVDYAHIDKSIGISDEELAYFYNIYRDKIIEFNTKFGKPSEKGAYINLTLPLPATVYSKEGMELTSTSSSKYLKSVLDVQVTKYGEITEETEKTSFLMTNKTLYVGIYELLNSMEQDYDFLVGYNYLPDGGFVYSFNINDFYTISGNATYAPFMDKARSELEVLIGNSFTVTVGDKEDLLGRFLDKSDETSSAISVNQAYIAAVSAGVVYVPFKSSIGDTEFMSTFSSLVNGDENTIEAYSDIATFKKPLYLKELSNSTEATKLTVARLDELINSKDIGYIVSVYKTISKSEDSGTYVTGGSNPIEVYTSGDKKGQTVTPAPTPATPPATTPPTTPATTPATTPTDTATTPVVTAESTDGLSLEAEMVVLSDKITTSGVLTEPVLEISNAFSEGMAKAVLRNIFNGKSSVIDKNDIAFMNKSLYITPFGDIVLADNTIVFPAVANPTFYDDNYISSDGYIPFTDTFMSNYPVISSSEQLTVHGDNVKKILLSQDGDDASKAHMIEKINSKNGDTQMDENVFTLLVPLQSDLMNPTTKDYVSMFDASSYESKGFWYQLGKDDTVKDIYRLDTTVIADTSGSINLYPKTGLTADSLTVRNNFLSLSMYSRAILDPNGELTDVVSYVFDTEKLGYMYLSTFGGSKDVYGYEKATYSELITSEEFNRFEQFLFSVADLSVNRFGDAPGLLGLRSLAQDPAFGIMFYYIEIGLPIILAFVMIIFVFKFALKGKRLIFAVFQTAVASGIVLLVIYYVPMYLGDITNLVVNNSSNSLAFNSLELETEMLNDPLQINDDFSDFGVYGLSNSSFTLYNFTQDDLEDLVIKYDLNEKALKQGSPIVIDSNTGLFIQGNKLKMNIDRFFSTFTIETLTNTVSNVSYYSLEVNQDAASIVDYYTPYSVFLNGMVDHVNKISSVYNLSRSQMPYKNNIFKDAFFVNSYIKSIVFNHPNDYEEGSSGETDYLHLEALNARFPIGQSDAGGFYEAFNKATISKEFEGSLWFNTMVQNGYYTPSGNADNSYFDALMRYLDVQVRAYLLENREDIPYMSDEHIIKIYALHATMLFNSKVGTWNNKLYPERLNYEELTVLDTVRPVISKQASVFAGSDVNITKYVYYEYGAFGLLMLPIIILCQGATSIILTYFIYIMYLMLVVFLGIRIFFKSDKMKETVKGFLKLYGILMLVYCLNVFGLGLTSKFDSTLLSLVVLMLLSMITLDLSLGVLGSAVKGIAKLDFNNSGSFKTPFSAITKMQLDLINGSKSMVKDLVAKKFNTEPPQANYELDDILSRDIDLKQSYSDINSYTRRHKADKGSFAKTYSQQTANSHYDIDVDEDLGSSPSYRKSSRDNVSYKKGNKSYDDDDRPRGYKIV